MQLTRSAGMLLHVTSLPGKYGIGDFGPAAYRFVNFLEAAGQSVWQILPLCPPSAANSPYSSYSAFAGNTLLISAEVLVETGWLANETLESLAAEFPTVSSSEPSKVDYGTVDQFNRRVLTASFEQSRELALESEAFKSFTQQESWWLSEFVLYEAMREHFETGDWTKWPTECRNPSTVPASLLVELDQGIAFAEYKQFLFDQQWSQLKAQANRQGVSICGDMPIFVALESADVWANQSQFLLDADGCPTVVAGVPPDYFSETGQLWGNPLYDWQAMQEDAYGWWVKRFRRALEQFDLLRVDHFRGFAGYWEVPATAETAVSGSWKTGPGDQVFLAAQRVLGELPIWAEDLGDIDQPVHDLRDSLDFPTMRVMQFGFESSHDDFHRHTTYPEHCIGYTGTHDNDTLMGWYQTRSTSQNEDSGDDVLMTFLQSEQPAYWQIIDLLYYSDAAVAIVPVQDALGLGGEARMNVPGEAEGNWDWRVIESQLTGEIAQALRRRVESSRRFVFVEQTST